MLMLLFCVFKVVLCHEKKYHGVVIFALCTQVAHFVLLYEPRCQKMSLVFRPCKSKTNQDADL